MKEVHDNAKEERRKKYCCVRGSSVLNSLSGTDAFKMSIVRYGYTQLGSCDANGICDLVTVHGWTQIWFDCMLQGLKKCQRHFSIMCDQLQVCWL